MKWNEKNNLKELIFFMHVYEFKINLSKVNWYLSWRRYCTVIYTVIQFNLAIWSSRLLNLRFIDLLQSESKDSLINTHTFLLVSYISITLFWFQRRKLKMRRSTTSSIEHFFCSQQTAESTRIFDPPAEKPKINSDDVKRMQYNVLKQQKKKMKVETMHFRLMNKKLRKELGLPNKH